MIFEHPFQAKLFYDSMIRLSFRDKAPGQRECDEAIEVLNRCMREVDQASLAAISQQLAPREDISQEVGQGCTAANSTGAGSLPQQRAVTPALLQPHTTFSLCNRLCTTR